MPLPFSLSAIVAGCDLYWPGFILGLADASLKALATFAFFGGLERRSLISELRLGFGRVVISWIHEYPISAMLELVMSYLERLSIPILHPLNARHLIQAIGQVCKLLDAVR